MNLVELVLTAEHAKFKYKLLGYVIFLKHPVLENLVLSSYFGSSNLCQTKYISFLYTFFFYSA